MIYKGLLQVSAKTLKATDTYEITFSVKSLLTLKGEEADLFDFVPGQFLNLDFAPKLSRSYSIASTPGEDLKLLIKLVTEGQGSAYIDRLGVGDQLEFKGPFGHFKLPETLSTPLVFVATGTGIAPFRSMIKSLPADFGQDLQLFYGVRQKSDLAYLDELNSWHPRLKIHLALSQSADSFDIANGSVSLSRITPILETGSFLPETQFWICGNGPMVKETKTLLLSKGFEHIHEERFN